MVNHWDLFCKHKHQPPASCWVPGVTSLQKPSSALPYLAYKCTQPTGPCHMTQKWNSNSPTTKPGPLPHVEAAALSWKGRDWGEITVLIETGRVRSDLGGSDSFTTRAGKVKVAIAKMPTTHRGCPKKRKKIQRKHCFGYTQHVIHLSTTTIKDLYKIMLW